MTGPLPGIETFGSRICIIGPSNSGKSTLALALAAKLGVLAIHLDQLHHAPNTDWVPRPPAVFEALHRAAIEGGGWVIDGNYSRLWPQRLERATGIIWLHTDRWPAIGRYVYRTLFQKSTRPGALAGGKDSIKWTMIHHILVVNPRMRQRYEKLLADVDLPVLCLSSMKELNQLYNEWELPR